MLPQRESTRTLEVRRSNTILIEKNIIVPPDGGWGWMVILGSFLSNFIVDGIIYTAYGQFLQAISRSFKTEVTTVAYGNLIMIGFYYISGPITCGIINQFGFQTVGFIGGTIAAAAFLAGSNIHSSIYAFITVTGVIGGIGLGMVYLPAVVVVGYYFERMRPLATSIAVTGSAVGIMVLPVILHDIMNFCEWRTAFKYITGLCLMCTFLALIYRPIPPIRALTRDGSVVQILDESRSSSPTTTSPSLQKSNCFTKFWRSCRKRYSKYEVKPVGRHEVFFSTILLPKLSQYKDSHKHYPNRASVVENASLRDGDKKCKWCPNPIRNTLSKMLDFKLLKSPSFLLLALSGCVTFTGIFIPYIYVNQRAAETGISKQNTRYFYIALGLSRAVGRIICGLVSIIPRAEALVVSYVSITLCGVASIASFFLVDVYSQFAFNSIFGLTSGTSFDY